MPIHLSEICPPAFRASFMGVAYQFGTIIASASAQIEASECCILSKNRFDLQCNHFRAGGNNIRIILSDGTSIPNYGFVQGILVGVAAAFELILVLLGPENHGSHFEKHKAAFQRDGEDNDIHDVRRSRSSGSDPDIRHDDLPESEKV